MFPTVSEETGAAGLNSLASYDDSNNNTTRAAVTELYRNLYSTTSVSPPIVSGTDFLTAQRVSDCGFLPALGLLGMVTNSVNMVVFYRQGLRNKMNLCLFALAFVDFVYLLCNFLYILYCPAAFLQDSVSMQVLKWTTLKYIINFRYAFSYCSGTLTTIIATERCICVVWPMQAATIFNTRTMAWMILGTVVFLNLLCLPYALKHVVRLKTDSTGHVRVVYDDTDLYIRHKAAFQIVRDTILPSISFITFFVVSFVTVVTVRKLKTAMDWRQKTSSTVMDKRQITLVKILITVSCVYIACSIPNMSLSIVKFVVDDFSTLGKYRNLFFVTHRVAFGLLTVNSSVNMLIYYRQSPKFRSEVRACGCCFKELAETDQAPETKSPSSTKTV